jgi:Cys-tRNA(Pro) deacylase
MSVENVKAYFLEKDLPYKVMEFEESTETVERAAQALGVAPALIAKSLAFKVNDRAVLVVTKGVARIDNQKFKKAFQAKARMMSPDEVLEITGHPVGGVCPFGLSHPMEIYLDESLRPFERVYPAAGSRNSCIEINPEELAEVLGAPWIDVCK